MLLYKQHNLVSANYLKLEDKVGIIKITEKASKLLIGLLYYLIVLFMQETGSYFSETLGRKGRAEGRREKGREKWRKELR